MREVNYILLTTPGLYADQDNKTSRLARSRAGSHVMLFSVLLLDSFNKKKLKRIFFSYTVARIRERTMKIYSYNNCQKSTSNVLFYRTFLDELRESLCVSKRRLLFYVPRVSHVRILIVDEKYLESISSRVLTEKSFIPRHF